MERAADHSILNPYSGASPLFMAALNGHRGVVLALAEAGADLNVARKKDGQTALLASAAAMHLGNTEALIKAGADVNVVTTDAKKMSCLTVAASHNNAAWNNAGVVDMLLAAGADIHHKSSNGTALEMAIKNGNTRTADRIRAHIAQRSAGAAGDGGAAAN